MRKDFRFGGSGGQGVISLAVLLAAMVLILGALEVIQTQIEFNQTSTALQINMAFVYAAMPIWGILFIVELVFMTIQAFKPTAFKDQTDGEGSAA